MSPCPRTVLEFRIVRLTISRTYGIVVEGRYVPKLADLCVLCMPASFVTYQRPQGLMQDCLRHWAESQYWCQKWDVNHSWFGPVLNLGLLSLDVSNFPGLSGGGGTMVGEEDSSYMLVFSCQSWGVQPSSNRSKLVMLHATGRRMPHVGEFWANIEEKVWSFDAV